MREPGQSIGVAATRPLRITFLATDAPAADDTARAALLAPAALLGTAGAVRSDRRLRDLGVARFGVLDRGVERLGEAATAERVRASGPLAVVLSAGRNGVTPSERVDDLIGVGRRLGAHGDPLRIALLGERPEDAEAVLLAGAADLALLGEPDEALPRVLERAITAPGRWDGLPGVLWRSEAGPDGHSVRRGPAPRPAAVRSTPAWDLLDLDRYASSGTDRGLLRPVRAPRRVARTATVLTSSACSPGCRTCHQSFGSSSRDRPVRDVVAEIRDLVHRRGVRQLVIADHGFDGRPARATEIARAVARLRSAPGRGSLTMSFPSGLRGDGLTPELVEAFLSAGVRRFPLRVVSASRRLQRLLKSNVDLGAVSDGIERVVAAGGALAHLELRLGLPTETAGEVATTIRWAQGTSAHTAAFLPGRDVDLGLAWTAPDEDEIDDFPALRRRALLAFYGSPRRAARLSRAAPKILPELLSGVRPPLRRIARRLT